MSAKIVVISISVLLIAVFSVTGDESGKKEKSKAEVQKTEAEWKKQLTPEQYKILREHGTEKPWGETYDKFKKQGKGTYHCVGCDAELFTSNQKFDARCGWPAFFDASKHENLKTIRDTSFGMIRVEVRCKKCDGHLGHIFEGEGFNTPTDKRYCINGKVLKFVPEKGATDAKSDKKAE